MPQAEYVLTLQSLSRNDLASAGGKGANLGELLRAGFSVPGGFVVSTQAYAHFVAASALDTVINRVLADHVDGGATIRAAFTAAPIPQEIAGPVLDAYRALGSPPVAVRSSATAEDLPGATFAGQQDTYLNIVDEPALLEAVRRCWASLWTDRALSYRRRQAVDQRTVKLAVVVQRMVAADVAGVMFTANPISGERNHVVIDASPGLGEAVVSGQVTPDHYVVDTVTGAIQQRMIGRREVVIRAAPGGGVSHMLTAGSPGAPALPDAAITQLAALGRAVENTLARRRISSGPGRVARLR